MMVLPWGSSTFLLVGSKVANSLSAERTEDPDSLLSKVDLPALVYPTSAKVGKGILRLFLRLVSLRLET